MGYAESVTSIVLGNLRSQNIHLPLVSGLVALPMSVVTSRPTRLTHHNDIGGLQLRVEVSAPSQVVRPSSGRHTSSAPEGDPLGFLGLRYPRPLEAAFLVEGHDIAHGRGFYTRPPHPTDPIGGAR
jgi:hypothetical protein